MRRRCIYTVTKKSPRREDPTSKEIDGWLLQLGVFGNATVYFVETPEGGILRLHGAYTRLRLLPEEK